MHYLTLKALHIIFIVSWFAGLFFLGRILVYHREALEKDESEKKILLPLFESAAKRVWYIITLPSLLITIGLGLTLMMQIGAFREGWFHFKFLFVALFIAYNIYLEKIRRAFARGELKLSSIRLRLLNEVPFLFLVAITFTVFSKSFFSGLWAGLVVVGFAVSVTTIMYFIRRLKRSEKSPS
jgi:putative membrane protein